MFRRYNVSLCVFQLMVVSAHSPEDDHKLSVVERLRRDVCITSGDTVQFIACRRNFYIMFIIVVKYRLSTFCHTHIRTHTRAHKFFILRAWDSEITVERRR